MCTLVVNNMRIHSFDFFRFFFTLQICMWHMDSCLNFMNKGYIAVEFFFIMSGFFLYKSSIKDNAQGVFDYTINRIKRFYPPMLIMLIPTLLLTWNSMAPSRLFNDIFFISNSGVFGEAVNGTLWYLNILVIGGGFIYAMLKHFRSISISLILPLIVLLIYTYIFSKNEGRLEVWNVVHCFYMPLLRGIAGISLGVIICCVSKLKEATLSNPFIVRCLNILTLTSLIGILLIVFTEGPYDKYALVFFSIIILACSIKPSMANSLTKWKGWSFLGELTLYIYIVHYPLTRLFLLLRDANCLPSFAVLCLYVLMLIPCAYVLKIASKRLVLLLKSQCHII